MRIASDPASNGLLAALGHDALARWSGHLELTDLPLGTVLYTPGSALGQVWFPTTCTVSLMYLMQNGASAELAVIGCEGMVGLSALLGGGSAPRGAVVMAAGQAFRLGAQHVRDEFTRGGAAHRMLLHYTEALIAQMAQTAVCHRHHSIDQQLCRRLLLGLDRQSGPALALTQGTLGSLLGVGRTAIAASMARLAQAGAIAPARGRINVLDRRALEQRSCECYRVVAQEYARLLPSNDCVPEPTASP